MGLLIINISFFFQCVDRIYTSESDIYRRHILTYKDGPALRNNTKNVMADDNVLEYVEKHKYKEKHKSIILEIIIREVGVNTGQDVKGEKLYM